MSQSTARPLNTVFHVDLTDAHAGEDYWVSVAGQRVPLAPHTPATLAAAHAAAPHLKAGRTDSRLTHFTTAPVAMPRTVIRVHLRNSQRTFNNPKSDTGVSLCAIYIPPSDAHLAGMADDTVFQANPIDYISTAQTFLFHHPDLLNKDTELARKILDGYMIGDKFISEAINQLALQMRAMGPPTETSGWAKLVPFTPDNPDPQLKGTYVGKTYYTLEVSAETQAAARPALNPLLIKIKNDLSFRDTKWSVTSGASVVSAQASPRPGPLADAEDNWDVAVANTGSISGLKMEVGGRDSGKKQVSLSLANEYLRYLGAYIRFLDAAGNAIKVTDWKPDDAGFVHDGVVAAGLQYDDIRFLGMLSPKNNVFAIPIPPDGTLDVKVTFPPHAVSASVYGSGIGTGADLWPKTPVLGGALTGVFNLGVPAFMLGFGVAAQSYKPLYDIVKKLAENKVAIGLLATIVVGYIGGTSGAQKSMNWSSFTRLVQFLFDKSVTAALVWVEADIAGEEAAEQIPFAGWIMLTINICTGIAQMAETIVEVATSDWNIEHKIATTITTEVVIHPDPRAKAFPQGDTRTLVVKMTYQDQKRPTVQKTIAVPTGSTATSFTAAFPLNTLGGQVKFEADFFVGDWLAGKATTGFVPNDAENAATVALSLIEFPRPLTEKSIYAHARILTFDKGAYGWTDTTKAPAATIADKNASPTGNALGNWTGLELSQRTGMLGPSWQAAGMGIADCATGSTGQLYAFMNLNIPGTTMSGVKFPSCGFSGQSRLIYDPFPPKFKKLADGNWDLDPTTGLPIPDPADSSLGDYYVDPRSALLPYDQGGGYHLRKVRLDDAAPFNMASGQKSYGRFAYFPDSVCLHPSGVIIGVSALYQKLQIVTLNRLNKDGTVNEDGGLPDVDVPLGAIGSGRALDQNRPGLMFFPVAVACAYDGTIIVLEDTKSSDGKTATLVARLSAYDLHMNPVSRFFDGDGKPSPWLYLANAQDNYYLDMSIVGDDKMTYIYVLYYTGAGASPSDYSMAIYTYGLTPPKSNPLVTTKAIPAARLAVDMWHSAYTLNFAMVTDANGNPAGPKDANTGPAGRTVPSVSMWLPPTS
jgi:hypothetical protein